VSSLRPSIATQLAVGYALLVTLAVLVESGAFYFGTVGVLDRQIDANVTSISGNLAAQVRSRPATDLVQEIERELHDGIDSDTEIFLLVSAAGRPLAGNLTELPHGEPPLDAVATRTVMRQGKQTTGRLIARRLADGGLLYVGRDLTEHWFLRNLVVRALLAGCAAALVTLVGAAVLFRRGIESRIGEIRKTTRQIQAGDLSQRIRIVSDDEFGRLSVDINRMLDHIGQLMEGVRHVSNAIAHDLRTPLARIRARLESALLERSPGVSLADAAAAAIEGIDELTHLFDKLLQIAEAESGVRAASFEPVDLNRIAHDMVELYDASAEEHHVHLKLGGGQAALAAVDRNLIATAVASLIDNAIKYAGPGATVEVGAYAQPPRSAVIAVRDDGPGIPAHERPRVTERFYRLDRSRSLPGNGLGLSIVDAIAKMHDGALYLEDANPGLLARMVLPTEHATPPAAGQAVLTGSGVGS
jgi:signal transduction histidine kinase